MIELKFSICDDVVFLNTSNGKFEKAVVKGVQVVPTGLSKSADGKDVCDGYAVLYQTMDGAWLSESELFVDEKSAKEHYIALLSSL